MAGESADFSVRIRAQRYGPFVIYTIRCFLSICRGVKKVQICLVYHEITQISEYLNVLAYARLFLLLVELFRSYW